VPIGWLANFLLSYYALRKAFIGISAQQLT